jgi:hypothetical protein
VLSLINRLSQERQPEPNEDIESDADIRDDE